MDIRITRKIDWVSLTFPDGGFPGEYWEHDNFAVIGKGFHGYAVQARSERFGVMAQYAGRDEMGTHLVFTGDCLAEIRREMGQGHLPVLRAAARGRARASRIDLAIDIEGGGVTPALALKHLKSGKMRTGARTWRFVTGSDNGTNGDTLYLGSRQSERFFRIYDKSAERKAVDGIARLRLEAEIKGLMARAALEGCMRHGVDAQTVGVFRDCIEWDVPEYRLALDAPGVALPELPRNESNTEKWLLTQCVPALAKLVSVKPEFRNKFDDRLSAELRRLDMLANGELE